jgi:hypothetical protein
MLPLIRQWLKPDWRKLVLFVLLLLITIGGQIQSWRFDDDPATKPPLYDLLRPLPLWFLWVLIMIPLFLLAAPLRQLASEIDLDLGRFWWLAMVAYDYLIACTVVSLFDWVRRRAAT